MTQIYQASGAFHLRRYSNVDISTGLPLTKVGPTGKVLRKQQSIQLCRKDERLHKDADSLDVQILARAKEQEIERWEARTTEGEAAPLSADMTVTDFYENVFMPQMRKEKTPATIATFEAYWRTYLKAHFNGTRNFKNYEPHIASRFLEQMAEKLGKNTVAKIRSTASCIFAYAIHRGIISGAGDNAKYANPWFHARKNIKCKATKATVAYTPKQVEKMIDALLTLAAKQGRQEYNARLSSMLIAVCFHAALRPEEALGLKWENVNLTTGTIHVCEVFVAGQFKNTTKTEETRTLKMSTELRPMMLKWHGMFNSPTNGLVFPNQSGTGPANVESVSVRVIRPTVEAVGVAWSALYACRRGWGTEAYNHGIPVELAAAFMGNSPKVFVSNYVKDKSRAAATAADLMEQAKSGYALGRTSRQPALEGMVQVNA